MDIEIDDDGVTLCDHERCADDERVTLELFVELRVRMA
jgi:hypothetical protein